VDETTQTSINGELGIENMVSHHTEILYSYKKEQSTDPCFNVDKP
jgi:hypothetical protein